MDEIEKDLQKLVMSGHIIDWPTMQNDLWDKDTKPYNILSFTEFQLKWNTETNKDKVKYALVRWFRYWSAKCDENIFCEVKAIPNPNKYDKEWDFQFKNVKNCDGVKFDLKSTRLPEQLQDDQDYYLNNPEELVKWMYENQSQQSRKGFQNRLFLVHIPSNGKTENMIRVDFDLKRKIVKDYFDSIELGNHQPYRIEIDGHQVIADVVFVKDYAE